MERQTKETFSLKYGIGAFILYYLLCNAIYIVADYTLYYLGNLMEFDVSYFNDLMYLTSCLLSLLIVIRFHKVEGYYSYHFKKKELIFFDVVWILMLGFGLYTVRNITYGPLINGLKIPDNTGQTMNDFVGTPVLILGTTILGPIIEELFYRGFLLEGLLNKRKPITAILISSICFGIMHIDYAQSLHAFIAGLLIGYVYYKMRSLYLVIILHIANNSLVTHDVFYGLGLEQVGSQIIGSLVFLVSMYLLIKIPPVDYGNEKPMRKRKTKEVQTS